MAVYSVLRLLFFLAHPDMFRGAHPREVGEAFIHGLRFDMVAVVFSNLPIFLLLLLPSRWQERPWFARLKISLFVFLNLFFIACNLADLEMYQFAGRRMTVDLFRLVLDIKNQLFQLAVYYWYLTFVALLLAWGLSKMFPRFQSEEVRPWWRRAVGGLLLISALSFAARGGWQLKPLKPTNAFIFSDEALGVLALNSTFTLLRSTNSAEVKGHHFFANDSEVGDILPSPVVWAHAPTHENVVLIIMESFALEFMGVIHEGKGYTPFLDELALKAQFYRNGFANGRRSIEAIPSLLSGIPSWLQEPLITSNMSGNRVDGLGQVLKAAGYETAFFHGAENGTMYFDSYARRVGFDHYFGLNEYPNKKDFDGNWGIYDEPFLSFAAARMSDMTPPFGAVIFTLSSHQPYSVPKKYAGKFPKGTLEIHESIGYADFALRQFFAQVEKEPWYSNTLFVITADHTTKTDRPGYDDLLGRYRVPVLFYHPGRLLPESDPAQPVQHVDVPLSVMHLLGLRPTSWSRFGHSVFDSQTPWAMNRTESSFWYLEREHLMVWQEERDPLFYEHEDTYAMREVKDLDSEKQRRLTRRLHALLQYFFNGMMSNDLPVPVPPDSN